MKDQGRSAIEILLYCGIGTFFLWPFLQLWSITAVPLIESDSHQRAAAAVHNILQETLSRPLPQTGFERPFHPLPGYEDLGLEGSVTVGPHPDLSNLTLVRAQVRWGVFFFRKSLLLEAIAGRSQL